jgi:hypothetical protein
VTGPISPEDRALIEHTRKVNKTLSLFVFALQERSNVPTDSQIGIAEMLVALADTIKTRAAERAAGSNNAGLLLNSAAQRLQIEAPRGSTDPNG